MTYDQMIHHHMNAAMREEQTAAKAACEESYRCHNTLAELHRREAQMRASIADSMRIAFGE
jgi:hypothetical protein